ncbi:TIGR02391 family protein [Nocardia tengchongensis]|uniref:TIGR02391 family protein n=1 Tax=Nocardia tengchongensis TaxID=2055889 RepID=UPI00360792BF
MTAKTLPQCGRPEAIRMAETVRPILAKLYPEWQSENQTSKNDEFKSERDAARKLLARLDSHEEVLARLGGADTSPRITAAGLHPLIWKAASAQWSTGHRHEAVLAAAKAVASLLETKVSRRDLLESDLIKQAFSDREPEPGKPRLRYLGFSNEKTAESMRRGVMEFGGGCFAAIRNPVGHVPNEELDLDEQTALERLAALSLFARWIDEADLVEADAPA